MKTPRIRPLGKMIFLKPDGEESRVTKSGLLTPSNVEQAQKAMGTVIAVGSKVEEVKKGERIIYGAFAGDPLVLENVEYKLIHEDDALAVHEIH